MSSSSSDSDSDDIEPIRRIKINIKPKDQVAKKDGADVAAIKASVEAWRPLGPRPHPSLTRRQSSLSSMSSLSLGTSGLNSSTTATPNSVTSASTGGATNQYNYQYYQPTCDVGPSGLGKGGIGLMSSATATNWGNNTTTANAAAATAAIASNLMRSSPSCSSLVNEFSNRASFSNFMSNSASRTSSPLTYVSTGGVGGGGSVGRHSESSVPIAIAIQESIELTVRGQQGQPTGETKTRFDTRALGNIKVAFPNSFARLCSTGSDKPLPSLKLRLHSTDSIIRYYASGLVKDLDSENSSLAGSLQDTFTSNYNINNNNNNNDSSSNINSNTSLEHSCSTSTNGSERQTNGSNYDLFDMNESPSKRKSSTKIIEFDMSALSSQLKKLYDETPGSRYYNIDVLRYQIMPLDDFDKCPLQVCAFWKVEPALIKLRVDFKHSNQSGLTLERLREISFSADLSNLVPKDLSIKPVLPNLVSSLAAQVKPAPSPSLSSSTNSNRDNFQNVSSNSSESSLLGDYSRTLLTNYTATTSASASSCHQPNGSFQMPSATPQPAPRQINKMNDRNPKSDDQQIRLPPPPSSGHSRHQHHMHSRASNLSTNGKQVTGMETLRKQPSPFLRNQSHSSSGRSDVQSLADGLYGQQAHDNSTSILDQLMSLDHHQLINDVNQPVAAKRHADAFQPQAVASTGSRDISSKQAATTANAAIPTVPYITYEPQAHWNDETKQLVWRFDNLLSYYKSDGYGSLLAKLDFRQGNMPQATVPTTHAAATDQQPSVIPSPIDVKFMVVDSTLSKINLTIDSTGYRMSLLKKEVRSGRYKSEPYTF